MSQYHIEFYRSIDFNENQWKDYVSKFNKVFKKEFEVDHFKKKYFGSCLEYSFHGVLFYADEIVGMYSAIPRYYNFLSSQVIIAQGCDAFILPEHRKDEMYLKQMSETVIDHLKKLDIFYHISIPNKTAYPYWKYFGGWKDIYSLNYYVVPLRAASLIKKWKVINALSIAFFKVIIKLSCLLYRDKKNKQSKISLLRDEKFKNERFTSDYHIYKHPNGAEFVFKSYLEDGIRTTYLIDCFPLNKKNISLALNRIIKEKGKETDIIMFVGKIEELPFYFIKIPKKYEPRLQPFIGLCFNEQNKTAFMNAENWDLSLANFDNR